MTAGFHRILGLLAIVWLAASFADERFAFGADNAAYALPKDAGRVPQVGHSEAVQAVAFSPDGRFVLSGSADQTMKLWDAATGALIRTFGDGAGSISSVAFASDGRYAASADPRKMLTIVRGAEVLSIDDFIKIPWGGG
jgi:WD40 repeat protein